MIGSSPRSDIVDQPSIFGRLVRQWRIFRLQQKVSNDLAKLRGGLLVHDTHLSNCVPPNPDFLIYDCVDLPLMHQRSGKWRREKPWLYRMFIDWRARKLARRADMITITSPAYQPFLKKWIGKFNHTFLLRNFLSMPVPASRLPEDFANALKKFKRAKRWMVVHNRIAAFTQPEELLQMMKQVSPDWGLCFIGETDLEPEVLLKLADRICPQRDVCVHGPLWGDEKLAALKWFDLGLTPLFDDSQNLKRCLPNRFMEFYCLGGPQVITRQREMMALGKAEDGLVYIPDEKGFEGFASKVVEVTAQISNGSSTERKSAKLLRWEGEFEAFGKALQAEFSEKNLPKKFTILSETNWNRNSRLQRLRDSLSAIGFEVELLEVDLRGFQTKLHKAV